MNIKHLTIVALSFLMLPFNNCSQSGLESASQALYSEHPIAELYLASKSFSHGSPASIKTDGTYNFTSRQSTKQAVWDFGTNQYYYGNFDDYYVNAENMKSLNKGLNDPNVPWNASSYVFYINESVKQRHSLIDGNYLMDGNKGFMGWHKALSKTGESGEETGFVRDKLYLGFWAKVDIPWFGFRFVLGYKNLLGNFKHFNASKVGEEIQIELEDGSIYQGRLIKLDTDNQIIEFWTPPGKYIGSTKRNNISITGLETSATLQTDSITHDTSPSSIKILRVWDDRDGIDNFIRTSVTNDLAGFTGVMDYNDNPWAPIDQSWNYLEYTLEIIDRSTGLIEFKFYLNGKPIAQKKGNIPTKATTNAPQAALIGLDANKDISGKLQISELIQDHDFARVYIANSENWNEATHIEPQRILGWSNSEIQLEVNKGSFSNFEDKYIFIFDEHNNCINAEKGLKIIL